jgi:phage terminase large subunit-like protein
MRHPKSKAKNKALVLDPWHERILQKIYGPSDEHGNRLCRVVYAQIGRGNRKTSLGAILCLLHTFFEPHRITGGQIISAAADRKQARLAFEECLGIISATPKLQSACHPQDFKNRINHPGSRSVYEAISADAATQYGRTPFFALVDELWAHKKADLWHSIRTGLTKVPGSLLVITTTAGRGTDTPDYPIYEYAKKVESGEIDDPGFLPIIFEAPKDCDWLDEDIWAAVNPGLQYGYPDIAGLRQLAREAKERPGDREAFQQFHLGIRQEHSTSPFVDIEIFEECRLRDEGGNPVPIDLQDYEKQPCWIGVDCSTTQDITAVVAVFRDDDKFVAKSWGFVPEDNLQARADRDGVPYPRWAKEGWIIATDGNVIDYRAVEKHIRGLCEKFEVQEIAFDPAYANQIMGPLTDDGFPTATMRQGWVTQSPALNVLERAIVGKNLVWDNPVMKWCMGNVAIHTDSNNNRTIHKGKSKDRVDLISGLWMAVSRAAASDQVSALSSDSFDPNNYIINLWG